MSQMRPRPCQTTLQRLLPHDAGFLCVSEISVSHRRVVKPYACTKQSSEFLEYSPNVDRQSSCNLYQSSSLDVTVHIIVQSLRTSPVPLDTFVCWARFLNRTPLRCNDRTVTEATKTSSFQALGQCPTFATCG